MFATPLFIKYTGHRNAGGSKLGLNYIQRVVEVDNASECPTMFFNEGDVRRSEAQSLLDVLVLPY